MAATARDSLDRNTATLVVTRVVGAPRALVFEAWTKPEHLTHWWGAHGFVTHSCTIDLRPGGVFQYHMQSPQGRDYRFKGVYREVIRPELIAFTNGFVDEHGNAAPHPDLSDWPRETLITVTFVEHRDGTKITLEQTALSATERERAAFTEGSTGARVFWTETLERFAEALPRA